MSQKLGKIRGAGFSQTVMYEGYCINNYKNDGNIYKYDGYCINNYKYDGNIYKYDGFCTNSYIGIFVIPNLRQLI